MEPGIIGNLAIKSSEEIGLLQPKPELAHDNILYVLLLEGASREITRMICEDPTLDYMLRGSVPHPKRGRVSLSLHSTQDLGEAIDSMQENRYDLLLPALHIHNKDEAGLKFVKIVKGNQQAVSRLDRIQFQYHEVPLILCDPAGRSSDVFAVFYTPNGRQELKIFQYSKDNYLTAVKTLLDISPASH
jgi:hypothetical protein